MIEESITRSLEDYRRAKVLGVGEFAEWLGITQQTYRRLLRHPETVRNKTKRQVLARLGVRSPYLVYELAPQASKVVLDQLHAIEAEADREGWIVCDPSDPLTETGELHDGEGNRIER